MAKHLTPTQKRLMEELTKNQKLFVRTFRVGPHKVERLNQYEADQVKVLENMGKLKIIRHINHGPETTIIAALA